MNSNSKSPVQFIENVVHIFIKPYRSCSIDIFTFKTIICFQRGNSPLARDSWTSIDDIPRSNCIRRNWVQQLRQHDICIQNGKPTFISITILVTAVDMSLSNSNSNSNYFPISINRSQGVLLSPWWCTTIRWLLL